MLWNSKLWLSPIDDSFNPSKSQKEQDLCLIYFFTNCRSLKIAGRRWTWASMSEYLLVCYHMRKGRILDNFFCSLIHKLLEVDKIVNPSALIWTQTNYLSHAIIVYKKMLQHSDRELCSNIEHLIIYGAGNWFVNSKYNDA